MYAFNMIFNVILFMSFRPKWAKFVWREKKEKKFNEITYVPEWVNVINIRLIL